MPFLDINPTLGIRPDSHLIISLKLLFTYCLFIPFNDTKLKRLQNNESSSKKSICFIGIFEL